MQANSREWCGIFDRRLRSSTRRKIICALDFADFQPVLYAATVMNAFSRPWCVAGGWAIDLWLGRATRGHTGVSVAIFRDDQIALRDFLGAGWRFWIVGRDGSARPWRRDDRQMLMLPVQQVCGAPTGGRRRVEFYLHESDSVDWIFRHDARVRWPIDQWTVRGAFGVPALAPHLAMLFKSTPRRPQDELDFRSVEPELPPELKRWLADAIELTDPQHPWIDRLRRPAGAAGL